VGTQGELLLLWWGLVGTQGELLLLWWGLVGTQGELLLLWWGRRGSCFFFFFEILFSIQPVCLFLAQTINFTELQVPKGVRFLLHKEHLIMSFRR
jgi:hypothetical protein